MKYGIKVIMDRDPESSVYSKTKRGWESLCGEKLTYDLNVAFKYLMARTDYDCFRYVVDIIGD